MILLLAGVVLIGLVTAAFGHFVLGAFPSFGEATWSATSHLVDPGSIADDSTGAERAVGLIQVFAGIVFFVGIVLTVLTELIDRALRKFQAGDPALSIDGHLLIVGFNRSLEEVGTRLVRSFETGHPQIVVMLSPGQAESRGAARRALAGYPARTYVVVADPEDDGYFRVCAGDARQIVILSPEGDADPADLEVTGRAILLEDHLSSMGAAAPAVAVEFRRERNVDAYWLNERTGSGRPLSRFPKSFDALVNDRNIGTLLRLAVTNPSFADTFIDDGTGSVAPVLLPAGACAGLTFGEARGALKDSSLLGVLTGTGRDARAHYLPDDERPITSSDRLVVIEGFHSLDDTTPSVDHHSVKMSPTHAGSLLMVGWSVASRALFSELESSGFDLAGVHVLNPEPPTGIADPQTGTRPGLIEGDPSEAADIANAVQQVGPETIFVAVSDGNEAGAVVSGMLARRTTEVPVLVEQFFPGHGGQTKRIATGVTIVSSSGMIAETVAMSLVDPAILIAREWMLNDPGINLESLVYTGQDPLPLGELLNTFGRAGPVPLAASLSGKGAVLREGDRILALQKIEAPVNERG